MSWALILGLVLEEGTRFITPKIYILLNNPKNLGLSYKMDLDFFLKEKKHLKAF